MSKLDETFNVSSPEPDEDKSDVVDINAEIVESTNENISLEKINPGHLNIASSWTSASFSHDYATPGYENSNFIKKWK